MLKLLSEERERTLSMYVDHYHNRAIANDNLLKSKEELEKTLEQAQRNIRIVRREKEHFNEAKKFLMNFQNRKYKQDAETIKQSMQLASTLVKQKNPIVPKFLRKTGARPESIIVVNRNGHPVNLALSEGTGVAESIASLTVLSVLQSTNHMQSVFFDEMFASVSPDNSITISDMLNPITDNRFQMTLIEQKNEIFQNTDYRDFHITYDGITSKVLTYDVKDKERTLVEFEGDN